MKYSAEEIGKRIQHERSKKGWSQEGLGITLGQKSKGKQVCLYESGTIPPIDVLLKLCEIFNCELGYLLGDPDYTSGNKFYTSIENELGLSIDSINSILHITSQNRSCLNFGHESTTYRRIINAFLSAPDFKCLVESLFYLDYQTNEMNKLETDLMEKYGKEVYDKALEYYTSTTAYFCADTPEKLPEIYYNINKDIEEMHDKKQALSYSIKVLRYEVHEAFERLLYSLYPLNKITL